MKKTLQILLCFLLGTAAQSRTVSEVWRQYLTTPKAQEKIKCISQILQAYTGADNQAIADSLLSLAIEQSLFSGSDTLRFGLLQLSSQYSIGDNKMARERAEEMLQLATKNEHQTWTYEAYLCIAKAAEEANDLSTAEGFTEKAYRLAILLDDREKTAECLLLLGSYKAATNRKLEAFDDYIQGLYLAEKANNNRLRNMGYEELSSFYKYLGNFSKTRDYKMKQLLLTLETKVIDSAQYMRQLADLDDILFDFGQRREAEAIFYKIADYAERKKDSSLKQYIFTTYRSYLIENNLFYDLVNFYEKKFPEELKQLQKGDTFLYYRVMAYALEVHNKLDSARLYYQKMEQMLASKQESQAYFANFYRRYAQFLQRAGWEDAALEQYKRFYDHAVLSQFIPFIAEAAKSLEDAYAKQNDFTHAYHFANIARTYRDSVTNLKKADELLMAELDFEARNKQLAFERAEEQTRRRHNLQYLGMTWCIILSFIVLITLGSFKVHRFMIRAMGFFSFIFFFEFIILLADHQIYEITHGEPWKIIALKIVLIAFLLPLHHWMEEKVVHYLSNHKLIGSSRISFRKFFGLRPKPLAKIDPQKETKERQT